MEVKYYTIGFIIVDYKLVYYRGIMVIIFEV